MSAAPIPAVEAPPDIELAPDEVEEEAPQDEAPEDTTDVEDEAEGEGEVDDAQAILDAIAELEKTDPELAQAARARLAPPDLPPDEKIVQWETQRDTEERARRVENIGAQAQQYATPQVVYERALQTAHGFAQSEAERIQGVAQALANGDESVDPTKQWVFDAEDTAVKIANHVAQEADAAYKAGTSYAAARTEDVVLAEWAKSPVSKFLNTEERQLIKNIHNNPSIFTDHKIAHYNAIYAQAAIRGGPELREGQTKAQAAAAAQQAAARQKALETIGRRMPGTKGAITGRPTLTQYAQASAEQREKWEKAGVEPLSR